MAEADEAAALVEALEERIRSGDATVAPGDLTSARELAGFARLQCEAAQRRAHEARRDLAETAVQTAVDDAKALAVDAPAELEALRTTAAAAFVQYADALDRLSYQGRLVRDALQAADMAAAEFGLELSLGRGVWSQPNDDHIQVNVGGDALVKVPTVKPRPFDAVAGVIADAGFQVHLLYANEVPISTNRPWPPVDQSA